MIAEKKLEDLGLKLPEITLPVASYVVYKQIGNLAYISGQGPIINGKQLYTGKVGKEVTREEGYQAAQACMLNILAHIKKNLGDLDRVKNIVQVKGYVASENDFYEQPFVVNGASDLVVNIFGEKGKHTRCALSVNVLPTNIPVEVEMIIEVA